MSSTGISRSITLLLEVISTWNLDTKFVLILGVATKKKLWKRAFNAKVMGGEAFVFVLKRLFWKVPVTRKS